MKRNADTRLWPDGVKHIARAKISTIGDSGIVKLLFYSPFLSV